MTANEMVHHYEPETKHRSIEYHQESSPEKKKSKPKLRQENSWLQFSGMKMMLFT
jgi:hypothetical protein